MKYIICKRTDGMFVVYLVGVSFFGGTVKELAWPYAIATEVEALKVLQSLQKTN